MRTYTIGEAAQVAGVTTRAIRLYEAKGLVPVPERTDAGYRLFTDSDIDTLAFIRRGRSLGLSLDAIAEVIDISERGEPCCDRTRALLAQRLFEIDTAIADLQQLRATIAQAQRVEADPTAGSRCVVIDRASSN